MSLLMVRVTNSLTGLYCLLIDRVFLRRPIWTAPKLSQILALR
jgi:hypothetical protein